MRRAILLCLGILLFTWLGFRFFPGHTYLQADTQIYLPILERLDSPGYLSRDLVATRPHVAFTIYDEVTLSLHRVAHLNFEAALIGQQLLFRAAGMWGIYLIATAAEVPALYAFLIAAFYNLGAALLGPAVLTVEYEPVPRGFAAALILLALGAIAHRKFLGAGIAAGLAFLYHPPTTAPFWGTVLLILCCDRFVRKRGKPLLLCLFVAGLLLANLAQLQPEIVESQNLFGTLSTRMMDLQHFRTRYAWVSLWAGRDIWHYLIICVCGLWAVHRIWPYLNRELRWFFVVMPLGGILTIPLSYLLLEKLHWALIPEFQPARALLYTTILSSVACGIAAVHSLHAKRIWEGMAWLLLVLALPIDVRVLDLFALDQWWRAGRLAVWLGLTVISALLISKLRGSRWAPAALAAPILAVFTIPTLARVENFVPHDVTEVRRLAEWAQRSTWGSSVFLFPDAGHGTEPGVFRALSYRALWVDWKSGGQVNYFESFGEEWFSRFEQTVDGDFSVERLRDMLDLPIDYYVLKPKHKLKGVLPVYENRQFVVYDAQDLRNASTSLRAGTEGWAP